MNLNVKSPFFLTQALLPQLRAAASTDQPAKVINVASIDGIWPNPMETYSYYASKSGLIHPTRRMAATLIRDNIVVTAIAPGAFASEMNRDARDHADELAKHIPSRRIRQEEDIKKRLLDGNAASRTAGESAARVPTFAQMAWRQAKLAGA